MQDKKESRRSKGMLTLSFGEKPVRGPRKRTKQPASMMLQM
jgi:hypothetical protein